MSAYDLELVGAESVIMEMAEYTHLQHMLFQVHTDSPTGQVIDLSTSSDEPCVCILPDHRLLHETMELEQELELVMDYSGGGGGGGGGGAVGEKTPSTRGEVPAAVLTRVKREVSETLTEAAAYSCGASLNRPNSNSSARVCLEKRFRCASEDVLRQQDTQTAFFPNYWAMVQQSTESQEAATIHPQIPKWMNPMELSNSYGGALYNPITGAFGHISHIVEPNKHPQGLINANHFLSHRPERAAARAQCTHRTKQKLKVEKEAVATAPTNYTEEAGGRQGGPPSVAPQLEEPKAAGGAGRSRRRRSGTPAESSKCRENHNHKERDRRRRIRTHCNELNSLVPFCTPTTDKATTLQWTTAFLKHIQDVYGDSLKENFESSFYGQWTSTDSDGLRINQERPADTASTALAAEQ